MGLLDRVRERQNPPNGHATPEASKPTTPSTGNEDKPRSAESASIKPASSGGHSVQYGGQANGGAIVGSHTPPKPTFQRKSTADPSAVKMAGADPRSPADAKRASLGSKAAERKQVNPQREQMGNLKIRIHSELIDRLDLAALGKLGPDQASE